MHLHNRQIKAAFWNDPDLLTWPREERWFYEGLTQLADDSGCLEDSPFAFKLNLYPSPLDNDVTVEIIERWRDNLLTRKKLVRYLSETHKPCLYIINFHKHQSFKNPSKPDVPIPTWIVWTGYESNKRAGKYTVSDDVLTEFLQSSYDVLLSKAKLSQVKSSEVKPTTAKESGDGSLNPETSIVRYYEITYGTLPNNVQVDELMEFVNKGMELELVYEAIKKSRLANKDMRFAKGILKNQFTRNILTVVQAQADDDEHQAAITRRNEHGDDRRTSSTDNGISAKESITGGVIGWIPPRI